MAIPSFQRVMLPLLQMMDDGEERRHGDVFEALALSLGLSEAELKESLPSGVQGKFENRVRWAKWYLTRAGLLESTGHGVFRISDRGKDLLGQHPQALTLDDLKSSTQQPVSDEGVGGTAVDQETPEEALASTHRGLASAVAEELLQRVKGASPGFFERLVVELLVKMGYGGSRRDAAAAVGRSGDGGIDGVIKEDLLGLDVLYVQAKRWEATVGRPTVQAFAGSLEGVRARKGVLLTTSDFSKEARDYVKNIEKRIVLIDGKSLADLMLEHGVGVSNVETYVVKRVDEDYFESEAASVVPLEGVAP